MSVDREGITTLLKLARDGDREKLTQAYELVRSTLVALARARLSNEPDDITLTTLDLVNDVFLRTAEKYNWRNREHFFAFAQQAMIWLLTDHARRKLNLRRGGDWQRLALPPDLHTLENLDLFEVRDAVQRLYVMDPEAGFLVILRFFFGLELSEIAPLMGVSVKTAQRRWHHAKSWLQRELGR